MVTKRARIRSYAGGGTMEVGPGGRTREEVTGTEYLNDAERAWYLGQSTNIGQEAQNFLNSYGGQASPAGAAAGPAATMGPDPVQQQWQAQQNVFNAQQGQNASNQALLQAQANTFPIQQQQIGANQGVINAQGGQNAAQRAYIGQQNLANEQRMADERAIQAAKTNIADITATGRAQLQQDLNGIRYQQAGVPVETVDVPNGFNGTLPPGLQAKIKTQAEILQQQQADNEAIRKLQLDQASLAVSLQETNVAEARLAAARVGLTLDQANLLVAQAQNAAGMAGNLVDQSQLGLARSKAAPSSGLVLYTDPNTGQGSWITQAQADQLNQQYQNQRGLTQFGTGPLGAFSDAQIAEFVRTAQLDRASGVAELQSRGYTASQAAMFIDSALYKEPSTSGSIFGGASPWETP